MLSNSWKLWLAAAGSFVVAVLIEHVVIHFVSPGIVDAALMKQFLAAFVLITAVTTFAVMDHYVLRSVSLSDAIHARGSFKESGEDTPRAATILGYFILFSAWLVAWSNIFGG